MSARIRRIVGLLDSCAIQGRWNQLPLPPKSTDLVLGDGSFSSLSDARTIATVLSQVASILDRGCPLVKRLFARPQSAETPGQVVDALRSGKIGKFQVFKCRLIMALYGPGTDGVRLKAVYDAVCVAIPDRAPFTVS